MHLISDPTTTPHELVNALKTLQRSGFTNESPQFWSQIANSTNYSIDCRKRAALQLFARHFKPGMTFHQIAALLNRPTWLMPMGTGFFGFGSPPPGGDLHDNWAYAAILFDQPPTMAIWFRFKETVPAVARDLYQCLEGNPLNMQLDNAKVLGVVSEEMPPNSWPFFNKFGIWENSTK